MLSPRPRRAVALSAIALTALATLVTSAHATGSAGSDSDNRVSFDGSTLTATGTVDGGWWERLLEALRAFFALFGPLFPGFDPVEPSPVKPTPTPSPTPSTEPTPSPTNTGAPADYVDLQVLSFNDYHGHLEEFGRSTLSEEQDPAQHELGGVEHLSRKLTELRAGAENTVTVAAGDLIGGSTFLSGLFHDEPAIETLNKLGLDLAGVGNHEFDEGTDELRRIVDGGCHPVDGCYFPDAPYAGTEFDYLAANVIDKETGGSFLPGTSVRQYDGVKVGFIGMTLEDTPTLVNPAGVASVEFRDEVETANAEAEKLRAAGVESVVVMLHEGGFAAGSYNGCEGPSGPIVDIAENMSPIVDLIVTGHTHQPYVCEIADPDGNNRLVTSASSYGRVVTDTLLRIDRESGDVVREESFATNQLVVRGEKDAEQTAIIEKWKAKADPLAARVVGTIAEDVTGDAGGDRGGETPMVDLVADSILFGTSAPEDGGAQIAFMNVGGVRSDFTREEITNGEQVGEITYAEVYAVAPFGNLLVSMDLSGEQIKRLLEQQFISERGRQKLALGVSGGFTYTWNDAAPEGSKVVADSMMLNGEKIQMDATYRVATLNFLASGGDMFTMFEEGTNILGGPEDIENLVAYLQANPGIRPPADRVSGL